MSRITLVNPKGDDTPWAGPRLPLNMEDAQPRHSLTQLSAVLKHAGHTVSLLDLRYLSGWPEFVECLLQQQPDWACITAHTFEAETALECGRRIKAERPACRVIMGGIHFSMFPEEAMEDRAADYVIQGEGEVSLPRLIACPELSSRVQWGVPPDLDSLPFEDRKLYSDYKVRIQFPVWDLRTPILDMITGRGCPWQCRFCCGPGEQNLYTKPSHREDGSRLPNLRRRSVDHVMRELAALDKEYGIGGLIFHDDQFLIRREWTEQFCEEMIAAGYPARGVGWWAACRSDMICRFPEQIRHMRDAGLRIMSIGFESFSDPLLKWMQKGTESATHLEAARICEDLGIDIFANVMFGLPREDGGWLKEDDLESLDAIEKIQPKYFSPSYFSPTPGSWFFEWAQKQDLMIQPSGRRDPNGARMKGVDYAWLDQRVERLSERLARPWYHWSRIQYYRLKAAGMRAAGAVQ